MTTLTTVGYDADVKDIYAPEGTRLKQWVVDLRREADWERETCPLFDVPHHYDDFDDVEAASGDFRVCASVGMTSWLAIDGRDCRFCAGFAHGALGRPEMVAWFAARAARPPICADRSLLSDEVQPAMSMRDSPLISFLRGRR